MSDLSERSLELFNLLIERKLTMTAAESCTGGLISKTMTDYPGSSDIFWGSFITYSNAAKNRLLGVDLQIIEKDGAVSSSVVKEMATGAIKNSEAHYSVAVSGIAGPGGGSAEKPVGTVWIAVADRHNEPEARKFLFKGNRDEVRLCTASEALRMLTRRILGN